MDNIINSDASFCNICSQHDLHKFSRDREPKTTLEYMVQRAGQHPYCMLSPIAQFFCLKIIGNAKYTVEIYQLPSLSRP
jgi:hypothetical protein